jgi:hypothetical protein
LLFVGTVHGFARQDGAPTRYLLKQFSRRGGLTGPQKSATAAGRQWLDFAATTIAVKPSGSSGRRTRALTPGGDARESHDRAILNRLASAVNGCPSRPEVQLSLPTAGHRTTARRPMLAVGFRTLGMVVEYLHGMTDYRGFEYSDMLIDSTGVAIGPVVTHTPGRPADV